LAEAPPSTARGSWAPGPTRPVLDDGALHVWRADLATVGREPLGLLSQPERARAERLLGERHSELWALSRGLLRALLGRYLQVDGAELEFTTGEHGKPELAGHVPSPYFNLSHSGEIALYAFSATAPVGIDVELARASVDEVAIARRMIGAAEAERLSSLDPALRAEEFLRLWTRHEAELKCLGVGIGGELQVDPGQRPWVAELDIEPGAAAAVAVATSPSQVHCWHIGGLAHTQLS
jgi:4'-phosphopantetheinyl transferase